MFTTGMHQEIYVTTTTHTSESLNSLDNAGIRAIYQAVIGKRPVAKSRPQMVTAILEAQAQQEQAGDPEVVDNDPDPEPQVDTVTKGTDGGSQGADAALDGEATATDPDPDPEAQGTGNQKPAPEPAAPFKVKVVGVGNNEGSVLLCNLASRTGSIATVAVLGKEVRFDTSDGQPTRSRKGWDQGGWRLDAGSLPPVVEPTIEGLVQMRSRDLDIKQLQQVFGHLSGRETTSTTRTYLLNQIRLARAGKISSTGTRRSRSGEPCKVIPVSMPVSTVEALDAAWKRAGFTTRISFIRDALSEKLKGLGEAEVAGLLE